MGLDQQIFKNKRFCDLEIFVIITKFAFFQMKMKFIWGSTIEFTHSSFRKAPKGFNAVHMILSSGKLIVTMIDSIVIIAIENKSIIACPSICIDRRSFQYLSLYNRHKNVSRTVWYNRYKYSSISFENTKYRSFSGCSSSSFSSHSSGSKIRLIKFIFSWTIIFFYKSF